MLLSCLQSAQSHGLLPFFVDLYDNELSQHSIWDRLIFQLQKLLHHNHSLLEESHSHETSLTWGEVSQLALLSNFYLFNSIVFLFIVGSNIFLVVTSFSSRTFWSS